MLALSPEPLWCLSACKSLCFKACRAPSFFSAWMVFFGAERFSKFGVQRIREMPSIRCSIPTFQPRKEASHPALLKSSKAAMKPQRHAPETLDCEAQLRPRLPLCYAVARAVKRYVELHYQRRSPKPPLLKLLHLQHHTPKP